ncbi:MAG: type II secretion system protein [Planctomycetes bacterium]|nr:type II secretion system protein [Planctomycetota bacterium]
MCAERRREGAREGFTLVELLVVIGIISTLAGLVIPAAQYAIRRARSAACQHNLSQIGRVLVAASEEPGGYPHGRGLTGAETLALLVGTKIGDPRIFSCPAVGDDCRDRDAVAENASYAFAVHYARLPVDLTPAPIACDDGADHHDGMRNTLFSDGHVEAIESPELPEGLID